jgi:capsular exopolysaccharide synthesis family protein
MKPAVDERPSTLRDYLQILWRRKWVVLQALVLVPLVAFVWSLREPPLYQASSAVLVNSQNLAANLAEISDPTQLDTTRAIRTQTELARVPEVAQQTLDELGLEDWSPSDLLGISSVSSSPDSDILTFTVKSEDRKLAVPLATEYARQFTRYKRDLDTQTIADVQQRVQEQLNELEAEGDTDSPQYLTLVAQSDKLQSLLALQTARAVLVRPATAAVQVEPQPTRNAILGIALGLFLGLGLAALLEALDSRVRSARKVGAELQLPVLARIARPPRALRMHDRLVMLADPTGPHAEAFRMLRTNLELARADSQLRTIMVTSAVKNEGKSTTIANLAVAFARAGQNVTLVDLDLRGPRLDQFFNIGREPGLTGVASGYASLSTALVEADIGGSVPSFSRRGDTVRLGRLDVLPTGPLPTNPGEFVSHLPLRQLLDELAERSDLVLIDGPPLLGFGDALAFSSAVEGMLVVARLNTLRQRMLEELRRALSACPCEKLGVIIAGAETEKEYEYDYAAYGYGQPAAQVPDSSPLALRLATDPGERGSPQHSPPGELSDWADR